MKKYIVWIPAIVFLFANPAFGQDIPASEVPSVIKNNFLLEYPRATDIDWEMEKNCYKVDFELNNNTEYKIWYSTAGDIVKREEEISKHHLPAAILSKIQTDFRGYRIDEVDKVTTETEVYYEVELKSLLKKEWEITIDSNGEIRSKTAE